MKLCKDCRWIRFKCPPHQEMLRAAFSGVPFPEEPPECGHPNAILKDPILGRDQQQCCSRFRQDYGGYCGSLAQYWEPIAEENPQQCPDTSERSAQSPEGPPQSEPESGP